MDIPSLQLSGKALPAANGKAAGCGPGGRTTPGGRDE